MESRQDLRVEEFDVTAILCSPPVFLASRQGA